jgi:hypothetical protein
VVLQLTFKAIPQLGPLRRRHLNPKFAAGEDTSKGDADFATLYGLLERAGVRVMMAGDTHAFEYYVRENETQRPTHYFVNGGGGAY